MYIHTHTYIQTRSYLIVQGGQTERETAGHTGLAPLPTVLRSDEQEGAAEHVRLDKPVDLAHDVDVWTRVVDAAADGDGVGRG